MVKHPIVHVEFAASDPAAAARFYGDIFGWELIQDEALDYFMFRSQEDLGGGFNKLDETTKPGDVTVYIETDDIDATLAHIEECGGTTAVPKMEIPNTGWMALFMDPTGNRVGLYTPMRRE